ncbi:MAG: MurR/RpiR family transcriptional regulator [Clostridia bacterium]|nr:MurR/RpiR family transcriptional regulator [Clostridia bacterium]
MEKTMLNIKILYDKMGSAEKRIADWLLDNPGEIIPLSIVDLAQRCRCGEATIVRFARRLGFSGYQDMKISLAQEGNATGVSTTIDIADSATEVFDKVCNDIYCTLEKTRDMLDAASLQAACERILQASRIVIFGLGNSAPIAKDAEYKFLRAGLSAVMYSDNHMQVIAASHLTENDVVLAISHSGASKDIIDACEIARKNGATVIALTHAGKSPIHACSDILLYTSSDEVSHNILALNFRVAQLAVVNVISYYVAYHRPDKTLCAIRNTERTIRAKKC